MIPQTPRSTTTPGSHMHTVCGHMITGSGLMSYRCERPMGHTAVPADDPEPHFTPEVPRTLREWQEWQFRQEQRLDRALDDDVAEEPHVATALGAQPLRGYGVHPDDLIVDEAKDFPWRIEEQDGWVQGQWNVYREDGRALVGLSEQVAKNTAEERGKRFRAVPDLPAKPLTDVHTPEEVAEAIALDPAAMVGLLSAPSEDPLANQAAEAFPEEALRTREGDQQIPDAALDRTDDQSLLIADIERRRLLGVQRYGQAHRPFNGRNTLQDWYDEQLDMLVYARSVLSSAEATREDLVDEVFAALAKHHTEKMQGEGTPVFATEAFKRVVKAQADVAVDRVMGWVAAHLVAPAADPIPLPDEVLEALVIDGIHEAIHSEATWGEAANHVVSKIRREEGATPPYLRPRVDRDEVRKAIEDELLAVVQGGGNTPSVAADRLVTRLLGPEEN